MLSEVLNQGGTQYRLTTEGLARLAEFRDQYVRHESETTKRYARSGELSGGELRLPTPRDNGSPGPASGRPRLVRIDPESGSGAERKPASTRAATRGWSSSKQTA